VAYPSEPVTQLFKHYKGPLFILDIPPAIVYNTLIMSTKKSASPFSKVRKRWPLHPRTRVQESMKAYSRTRQKGAIKKALEHEIDEA